MFDKKRKRRVIYNDDADQQEQRAGEGYGYDITDEQSFIDVRTTPTFNTHVDTYVWCVGNGAEPPWNAGRRNIKIWPFIGTVDRATDIIVKACHAQGIEVWGSLRMNDVHDSFQASNLEDTAEPIKAEHPEYLLASEEDRHLPPEIVERHLWTALNFALPEVREYRLKYIEKNASQHDFDGYELDFTRFIWYFPLGQERKYAHLMTDFIRKVRELLDTIGRERGRPYTLVVHVPDSPLAALDLGLDVAAWLDEKLVDVLVVGMGYVLYTMKLAEWQEMAKQYNVPVYPSINTAIFTQKYMKPPEGQMIHESIRAICSYWWQEDAGGIYLFNLFTMQDPCLGDFSKDHTFAPLREIGEPALMKGKDKMYGIQRTSDRAFNQQGSETTPLPIALDNLEYELPLLMGPDADDARAKIKICALARGGDENMKVWFRLNHTLLEPEKKYDWYTVEVPKGVMRSGYNRLAIWCNTQIAQADPAFRDEGVDLAKDPIIILRVVVPVTYS